VADNVRRGWDTEGGRCGTCGKFYRLEWVFALRLHIFVDCAILGQLIAGGQLNA